MFLSQIVALIIASAFIVIWFILIYKIIRLISKKLRE